MTCSASLSRAFLFLTALVAVGLVAEPGSACTNILVTRRASFDGSVIITYNNDGAGIGDGLTIVPAADHPSGAMIDLGAKGKIPQVPHTYRTVGLMNEHQLAIAESTFGGRPELLNPQGKLRYEMLMRLGLQRARTAREALHVMTQLVAEHGYGDTGESISIADPQEIWLLEIVGTGPGGQGAAWVAVRIPDGHVSCHANGARIGEFPRNDPVNCLYSANIESLAISKGWYDPNAGQPFCFHEVYCPRNNVTRRTSDTRVWSILRRAAPSQDLPPDYHRSKPGANPYPLSIAPDAKLSVADVFALMRDHYEGTEYDMTQGVDAGPFGSPNRSFPLVWQAAGKSYCWERPISTSTSYYSMIMQSRGWLPDPVGGIVWHGVDDSYTCCYLPFYLGATTLPDCLTNCRSMDFSWDSAVWVFNFVANYANLKYSLMIREIQVAQKEVESRVFTLQPAVEKTAVELAKSNPRLMHRYLTDYCVSNANRTVARWQALAKHLIAKYNDGYLRDANGRVHKSGYSQAWLEEVLRARPETFRADDIRQPVE